MGARGESELQWMIQTHSILQILLLKSKETQATNPPKDTVDTHKYQNLSSI